MGREYIIICEDDHMFSNSYSYKALIQNIKIGINMLK